MSIAAMSWSSGSIIVLAVDAVVVEPLAPELAPAPPP
jgi:hypothetical protein